MPATSILLTTTIVMNRKLLKFLPSFSSKCLRLEFPQEKDSYTSIADSSAASKVIILRVFIPLMHFVIVYDQTALATQAVQCNGCNYLSVEID